MEVVLRDVLTVVAEFIAVVTVEVVLLVLYNVVVDLVVVVTVEVAPRSYRRTWNVVGQTLSRSANFCRLHLFALQTLLFLLWSIKSS